MTKKKIRMNDVVNAFFKYETAKSGNHSTRGGIYYYSGYALAEINKTKLIINPFKQLWPKGKFCGVHASNLLQKYITGSTGRMDYWLSEYPYIINSGWCYVYRSVKFDFPLVLNRRTKKIENKIDNKFIINKFMHARNIYNIDKIVGCINHFNIKVPENITSRKKEILCNRLTDTMIFSNMTIDTLFKLKTNENDIINIKNAIKNRISKCKEFYYIEEVKKNIDKYFKDDTELKSVLVPKYVELKFDQELGISKN